MKCIFLKLRINKLSKLEEKKLSIILNLLPLKTGGGVQVALDFINQINKSNSLHSWYIVCRKNSVFEKAASDKISILHTVKDSLFNRLLFEYVYCNKVVKKVSPDLIYTQFGPHWPSSNFLNIVGCAYSNLCYPELDFWGKLPFHKKMIKKFIDYCRLKRLLAADVRIFETEDLANRAKRIYSLSDNSVFYVKPAVSSLVTKSCFHNQTAEKVKNLPGDFNVLLLSGFHPNKNFDFLASIAQQLKQKKPKNKICFILTIPENQQEVIDFFHQLEEKNVQGYFYNIGPIPQAGCSEVYRKCEAVILPSRLESFSNNIAEAWAMEKPLITSHQDWTKSICADGALYYKYDDSTDAANTIIRLSENSELYNTAIKEGEKQLSTYPDSRGRFLEYLKIIENSVLTHGDQNV